MESDEKVKPVLGVFEALRAQRDEAIAERDDLKKKLEGLVQSPDNAAPQHVYHPVKQNVPANTSLLIAMSQLSHSSMTALSHVYARKPEDI